MDELREEIGLQMSLTGSLVKCRLRWAGHLVRMGEERMAKRADRLREQCWRKRRRLHLRWDDCVTTDIRKVEVVGDWTELAEDRGKWRSIVVKAGQKLGAILDLTPYKVRMRRRRRRCFRSL